MKKTPEVATKISRVFYILISALMVFLPWFKIDVQGLFLRTSFYTLFRESLLFAGADSPSLLVVVAFALLILAAVVGIILSILGKDAGAFIYCGVVVLEFVRLIVPLNNTLVELAKSVMVSAFSAIGLGAWLCLIFALLSLARAPEQYSDLEFLRLPKGKRTLCNMSNAVVSIPQRVIDFFVSIGKFFVKAVKGIGKEFADIGSTFKNGDWKTKTSYVVMGFGSIARGQILRGVLFLLFELVFIGYMVLPQGGAYWLGKLGKLGDQGPHKEMVQKYGQWVETSVAGDNSFRILLYGVLTIFFIIALIYTWRLNVKQNKIAEDILKTGKPLRSGKEDLHSMVDDQFHKTLLALPLTGILIFTVMPIVFMILVAFTNYDAEHDGANNLFTWVGLTNFNTMFNWTAGGKSYSAAFGEILTWTLIWAFFATFTNYFLGMLVAMMINKKGIKLKKVWRTVLVMTIAIPQFISLLYVSKMFAKNGLINLSLINLGWIQTGQELPFWEDPTWARITVILINIWIGIPYLMLIATGILMNIPQDLYESARIDGANPVQQFTKITLPYMLFITGPYLLTSFTGNMNNFNVIYLLTGGGPTNASISTGGAAVGHTDLLITWLFKITMEGGNKYYMASVVGILVFLVVAVISLVVYGLLPSIKNEEDFQ